MTRINTNVSSLNAQKSLARSNAQLQTALTRLSTGLRINVGKDDPAGLIASEVLRSDIISVERAITNSERANQMIAVADSSLGQVSALLNDIRGLVSEAANTGALSAEQIAANQLQVDSSLEAVDRIAQVTSFQGKRLLDGNMDFVTAGISGNLTDLQIDQANFGTLSEIAVSVDVVAQATRGELNFAYNSISESVVLEIGGKTGFEAFTFAAESSIADMAATINLVSDALGVTAEVAASATAGSMTVSSLGNNNDIVITADTAGFDEGDVRVKFTEGNTTATTATYTAGVAAGDPGTIDVALRMTAAVAATADISDDSQLAQASYFHDSAAASSDITFTAVQSGVDGNDITVQIDALSAVGASYNEATGALVIDTTGGPLTANAIVELVNSDPYISQFVTASLTGAGNVGTGLVDDMAAGVTASMTGGTGDLNNDLTITAKQTGTTFNATAVNIVDGNATAKGISSLNNYASMSLTSITNAVGLSFTSKLRGEAGNDIQVIFVAATAAAATVTVTGNVISIKADSTALGESTGDDIAALINNDVAASALVTAAVTANGGLVMHEYLNDGENLNNGHHAVNEAMTDGAGTTIGFHAKELGPTGQDISLVVTETSVAGVGTHTVSVSDGTITVIMDNDAAFSAADVVTAITGDEEAARLIDVWTEGPTVADFRTFAAGTYNLATGDTAADNGGLQAEGVEYSHDAKAASASITWDTNSVSANSDIIITATQAGTTYNNVSIMLAADAAATTPTAQYVDDGTTRTLTVTIDNAGAVLLADVVTAIEGVQDADGVQLFTVTDDNSAFGGAAGTVDGTAVGASHEIGNTANTGGDAGTLFLYVEEGVSSANDIMYQMANAGGDGLGNDDLTKRASELFTIASAGGNDGTGRMFDLTAAGSSSFSGGVDGGVVAADGEEVIAAINSATGTSGVLTASLATGNDGKDVVLAAFQEYALYGSAASNTRLQFLGGADSPDIEFAVSGTSTTLSIQDNRGFATITKDSAAAESALVFTAKNKGADHDGVRVVFVDDNTITKGNEVVTYEEETKTLKFLIAGGNTAAGTNTVANDVIAALAADDVAKDLFVATRFGSTDGTGVVDADLVQESATLDLGASQDITITAKAYGDLTYTVELTNSGAGGATTITYNSATGALVVDVPIADAISVDELVQLLNADTTFTDVFTVTAGAAAETNITAVTPAQAFTGGVGTDTDADAVPDQATTDTVTTGGRGSKMIVNLATDIAGLATTTSAELIAYFDDTANSTLVNNFGVSVNNAEGSTGSGTLAATTSDLQFATAGVSLADSQASGTSVAVNGVNARVSVTADTQGAAYDDVSVVFQNDVLVTAGNEVATYDAATKVLTVTIEEGQSTADQVIAAINGQLGSLFTAVEGTGGDGTLTVTEDDTLTLTGGTTETGTVQGAALLGNSDQATTGLKFLASTYGSDAFVSVKALSGTFNLTDANDVGADRSVGTDINVRINGIQAIGDGLTASINTSALDLAFSVNSTVTAGTSLDFTITGGGAQFQLGPDVVSNQQARLGIQSVSTAKLGGVAGRLFELRSGGVKALENDVNAAASVVEQVITQVTTLRGRLGAFQKTTLETNINSLSDTLENLTAAESSIRDADFAEESAALTRAQILVQSGISVLGIANSNPQNVLALLR